jgi:hypothetical protein
MTTTEHESDDYFDVPKARAALNDAEAKLNTARNRHREASQLRMASKTVQRAGMRAVVVDDGQPFVGSITARDGQQYIAFDDEGLRTKRDAALEAITLARGERDDALDRLRDAMRKQSDDAEDKRKVRLDDLATQQTNAAKSLGKFTIALVVVGVLQVIAVLVAAFKGHS